MCNVNALLEDMRATFGDSADWRLECTGAERRAVSSLLRDAVPPPQRARLWRAAVGIASRQFGEISAELFEALSEVPTESSGAPFQEKQKRQAMIQTDLRRTFPHLGAMFSGADSPYAQALAVSEAGASAEPAGGGEDTSREAVMEPPADVWELLPPDWQLPRGSNFFDYLWWLLVAVYGLKDAPRL